MQRALLRFALILAVLWPAAGFAQQGASAQALVGVWVWTSALNGQPVANQLTLAGDGRYAYTTRMQTYQVTSTGLWRYSDGWIQFQTQWSSTLDPTGRVIGLGPIQVLEVGPQHVRTPAGIAHRAG